MRYTQRNTKEIFVDTYATVEVFDCLGNCSVVVMSPVEDVLEQSIDKAVSIFQEIKRKTIYANDIVLVDIRRDFYKKLTDVLKKTGGQVVSSKDYFSANGTFRNRKNSSNALST